MGTEDEIAGWVGEDVSLDRKPGEKVRLVILVLSAIHYPERRKACRETWAKNIPPGVTVAFIMGGKGGVGAYDSDNECLNINFASVPDDYPSLPQKTRAGVEWAVAHEECQWVFKCDDDTYLHIPRLLKFVETNRADYVGFEMTNEWPSFASGGAGYLLSRKAASIVAEHLTDTTGCEDLLVSRVLINNKIPFTPTKLFHPWNNLTPTPANEQISAHYMLPPRMYQAWNNAQGQKIPKRFHWIWVGGKPMPDKFVQFMHGWIEKHPGWESMLWTDDTMPTLTNQREYDAAKNPAQKADIARYELLYRHGGVYLDVDMECLQNIESALQGIEGFSGAESDSTVAIGVMGCVPGHPLYAELIDALPASFYEFDNVVSSSGPAFFTRHCLGRKDFKIFPPWAWYPVHYTGRRWGPDEMAYATHHWSGSWRDDSPPAT